MVRCLVCETVVASGPPVAFSPSVLDGLVQAGFLLGACVDIVPREEQHQEQCPDAAFVHEVREISLADARAVSPWLGLGR